MRKWQQELGHGDSIATSISNTQGTIGAGGNFAGTGTLKAEVSGHRGNSASLGTSGSESLGTLGFAEVPEEIGITEASKSTSETHTSESRTQNIKKFTTEKCTEGTEGTKLKLTKYHYALFVFCVSLLLFCILKPFFVQTTQKDRSYESPNLSFITAFILSALVALGYLLVCD
jgi:hypothetical protein